MGKGRLRSSDLAAPYHGVRTSGEPQSVLARARALSARMTPDQYFSHTTAALLLTLRMPENFHEATLHITSVRPHRAARLAGVTGHESDDASVVVVRGMRVLNAIDTWMQLSGILDLDDLVVMGDGLVSRRNPLTTLANVAEAVSRYRGRGARRLREAASLVRAGTDSARETMLRLIVVRAGFPEPEVNGVIVNSFGAEIAHGDLVFRRYRTILEYEGRHHATDARQFAIDIARLDEVMEERWRVIRVDGSLMARRATLLGKLERALRHGGWTPS